jgi:hypothetical protein
MGIISNERIAELTGEEGGAGIGMMAESLTNASYRMSRSSLGTAMALATGKLENGRYTGKVDQEVVDRIRGGGISKDELLSMARKKSSTRGAKISFASQRNKITSEMASSVGVEGIAMQLQGILGERGWKNEDALNLVMQRYHMDEREAQTIVDYMKHLPQIQSEMGQKGQTEARRMAEQSHINENFSGDALKKKISTKFSNIFSEPFKKIGADLSHSISSYVDEFVDEFLGRQSVQITREVSKTLASGLAGGKGGRGRVARDLNEIGSSGADRGNDLSTGSIQRLIASASGTSSHSMTRYDTLDNEGGRFGKRSSYANTKAGSNTYGKTNSLLTGLSPFIMSGSHTKIGDYISQDGAEGNNWINHLMGLSQGKGDSALSAALEDPYLKNSMGHLAGLTKNIIGENAPELRGKSQEERMNFIREKLGGKNHGDIEALLGRFKEKGVSFSGLLSSLQQKGGVNGRVGSVDFGKMASEISPSLKSSFTSVAGMAKRIGKETDTFSSQFGGQKEKVKALMNSDSKARDLFLKAAEGDADAAKLLAMEHLPDSEKEELLHKFGIKDGELEGLQDLWSGAGNASVTGGKELRVAISSGAYAGAAKQLRDQGRDMSSRLAGANFGDSDAGGYAKSAIKNLAGKLTGINSLESLGKFVSGGGGGDIHKALSYAGGLKGKDREAAIGVLGQGAQGAFDAQKRYLKTGKISDDLLEDDDIKSFISGHKGGLKGIHGKEKEKLSEMIRDRSFTGSLAFKGKANAQDFQSELMGKLNEFARTSTQFAQLMIDATPALADNVKAAAEKHQQSGNKLQSNPNASMSGG